ncbi:MAG: hypothetical protein A3C79_01735 [Candidatus Taylorbacteria bacterium RIFCSPHIGHO2_02_FULL_45_28]|uniref:Uncharacterized protein n=1 Tax=Candidatus Taylorbacteria bacterium RIFCSPHIGHO2_12_FULL_45_16 TaxID=1802315 RepID=A0A1G2MZ32_9BACT|nr:MAG: hypothetical protein A2830_03890 [Candidatus Taylorbacteria bacterium RIFCSPHIGHO2_01_FULL_44_110]OHA25154.1 MAG: hypothetical protein A3C79_01735 [Candidatus Taylorbacteria bacterium RIFCSPHIGHO2_02_FULL_45_28]OHA29033.1 MAG: hypothetical protein A3F51_02110 [Candidatus Taylorbacteria bacterium RIFCSPHIGHO2_12_FULL_45_16]OHA33152.1 MAG: hypothetical protein A3A23_03795 [Candidatus Taylorbacteria bacterium RIFCSPLOWO2_01_FULL_45_59]OHA39574.1 MAG: hypothetical protein A3I98_00375 [Candi
MSSGVEFDEDKASYGGRPPYAKQGSSFSGGNFSSGSSRQPKMVAWLMRKGIVKSPAAAQVVLIAVVVVNLVITYYVITYFI